MSDKKAKKRPMEEEDSSGRKQQEEQSKDGIICNDLHVKKRKKEEHEERQQPVKKEENHGKISVSSSVLRPPLESSLSLERFTFHKLLGKGGYGKVFLASDEITKKVVALKIVRKRDLLTEASDRTLAEQRVLKLAAGSHYLAKAYGAFQTPLSKSQMYKAFPIKVFFRISTHMGKTTNESKS
ncbi:kinase C theta type-like isoform X2 [Pelobates cultripes]|uniref:Kinase C theta type-like isoform X2 n=1 Tax=Pelobates cultripes TaxID=61616 RepID=A0AAD1SPA6_PELCU|nr:kinase C theta type-like isoform X2 [Pelobates cultripes]